MLAEKMQTSPNVGKTWGDTHAPRFSDLRTDRDYWTVERVPRDAATQHGERANINRELPPPKKDPARKREPQTQNPRPMVLSYETT